MAIQARSAQARRATDRRELPAYSIAEASHYLRIPPSTLRWWVTGRYHARHATQTLKPIILLPQTAPPMLSFLNLIEIHVLDAIRRKHGILLPKVRKTLDFLEREYKSLHPLAEEEFQTDGVELFVEKYGHLISASEAGQVAMAEMLNIYLRRIERDDTGIPLRLYPFTRRGQAEDPRVVVIDPSVSFGRPCLVGTSIATAVIAERFHAGESVIELAEDYGRSP